MINKIKNKLNKARRSNYLDLTDNDWKSDKRFNLMGLRVLKRPYKKIALLIAALAFIFTSLIPGPNVLGFYLVKSILMRWG
jgi:hypothetical protein|tara:strand:- start:3458 stop:3700 length:243 start_codon:yes stop_codon:yes gene_type:complete